MTTNQTSRHEQHVKRAEFRLLGWTFAWVISIFMLGMGTQHLWHFNTAITIFMLVVNAAVGIGMILAYTRLVKGVDEMQQRIFLEAAALTLGVMLVFGGSYQLWKTIQLIPFEPQVWHMVALMGLTFMAFTFIRVRKYC